MIVTLLYVISLKLIIIINIIFIDGYLTTITPQTAQYCRSLLKSSINLRKLWNNELCGFPIALKTQAVGFIELESSFPFNVPFSISKNAGIEFRQGVTLHYGLGVIIASSSIDLLYGSDPNIGSTFIKFSIEFSANNYTGSIFPCKNDNDIQWNNNASIYVSNPLNTNLWLNSRIITSTTGLVYNEFIDQLYADIIKGEYSVFQPITIITPNISSFENYLTPINQNEYGTSLVPSMSSYTFVNNTIDFLLDKNCAVGAFLNLASTSIFYFQCYGGSSCNSLQIVPLNNNVYIWYENIYKCFVNNNNGVINWESIQNCYNESYAYVYKNATYVYKVNLFNVTEYLATNGDVTFYNPMIFRYIVQLPALINVINPQQRAMDYLAIVFLCLIVPSYIVYSIHKIKSNGKSKSKVDSYLDEFENRIKQDPYFLVDESNTESLTPMIELELKSINNKNILT